VVNNDIGGDSLDTLSIEPQKTISQRIADASDPRTPLDLPGALQALLKVGMIGLNSVLTVVNAVVTPDNIAQIATAGLVNPLGGLLVLGEKLLGAVPQLISPTTGVQLVQQAFQAVVDNVTDNKDLLNTATWVKYWDVVQRHGGYATGSVTADGQAPVKFVAGWFAALAKDVAAQYGYGDPAKAGVSQNIGVPFSNASGAADAQRTSGAGQFPFETNQENGNAAASLPGETTAVGGPGGGQLPFSTN
jgi:hypothetical protein